MSEIVIFDLIVGTGYPLRALDRGAWEGVAECPHGMKVRSWSRETRAGISRSCKLTALPLRLRLWADPFLVGSHPIISNFPLCSREGDFAAADLIMIEVF